MVAFFILFLIYIVLSLPKWYQNPSIEGATAPANSENCLRQFSDWPEAASPIELAPPIPRRDDTKCEYGLGSFLYSPADRTTDFSESVSYTLTGRLRGYSVGPSFDRGSNKTSGYIESWMFDIGDEDPHHRSLHVILDSLTKIKIGEQEGSLAEFAAQPEYLEKEFRVVFSLNQRRVVWGSPNKNSEPFYRQSVLLQGFAEKIELVVN